MNDSAVEFFTEIAASVGLTLAELTAADNAFWHSED